MALKNKNGEKIISGNNKKTVVINNNNIDDSIAKPKEVVASETKSISETSIVENDMQKEMFFLKKALLSVYYDLHVYMTRDYVNYINNNFIETNSILGFKHEKESITVKAELLDVDGNLYNNDNIKIFITKNNEEFNNYVLLEKTKLENSSRIVFKTIQTDSCKFQIKFVLTLENNETKEFIKEVEYIAYNKVHVGYFDRHTQKYVFIENTDIIPTDTCKGLTYEIKFYKLPKTKENHGERVCLCIPEEIYEHDNGDYIFSYNGFQMPLFLENNKIKINNENYYVFLSTSYYENDDNGFYDFSIKIDVV